MRSIRCLDKLVDELAKGKPLVKVIPIDQSDAPKPRIGFMKDKISVPDNFDELGRSEISVLFHGA